MNGSDICQGREKMGKTGVWGWLSMESFNHSFIQQLFHKRLLCTKCCPREAVAKEGKAPIPMVGNRNDLNE